MPPDTPATGLTATDHRAGRPPQPREVTMSHSPGDTAPVQIVAMPRAWFTAEEVASALALSESLIRQLTLHGDLPCRRVGRLIRYTQSDIDAFIESRENHAYRGLSTGGRTSSTHSA